MLKQKTEENFKTNQNANVSSFLVVVSLYFVLLRLLKHLCEGKLRFSFSSEQNRWTHETKQITRSDRETCPEEGMAVVA